MIIYDEFKNALFSRYPFLRSDEIISGIDNQFAHMDFSAKSSADTLIGYLGMGMSSDEWLAYVFDYALSLSFKDAAALSHDKEKDAKAKVFLYFFRLLSEVQKLADDGTFLSKFPVHYLTRKEIEELEDPAEYLALITHFKDEYVYEMMKIHYEITSHSTIEHIAGVHYLSVNIARQLKEKGIGVDLGRISGAALGHDIGKYGVKKDELKRIAYYHYYYSDVWFETRGIEYIRNIAVNHSTWDLELENLSVESLVLIYSDFRVKASNDNSWPYRMKFYSLKESFKVILDKLDNLDEAKTNRYRRVYEKLADFERFLSLKGVDVYPYDKRETIPADKIPAELICGKEKLEAYKMLAVENNILNMHLLRDEKSIRKIFEDVRSERDSNYYRRYLDTIANHFLYLTPKQKEMTIEFMLGTLWHNERDIRRKAAMILGLIIGTYDEVYKKEFPPSAKANGLTKERDRLLDTTVNFFFEEHANISDKKVEWVKDTGYIFFKYLAEKLDDDKDHLLDILYDLYGREHDEFRTLLKIRLAGLDSLNNENERLRARMIDFLIRESESGRLNVKLRASSLLVKSYGQIATDSVVELRSNDSDDIKELFLANLKTDTDEAVKEINIDFLVDNFESLDIDVFYLASHLSNLLKVSSHERIREYAGGKLVSITDRLSKEQLNDVAIELLRALEMEDFQATKYLPGFLGRILNSLGRKEIFEILDDVANKVRRANAAIRIQLLRTIGTALEEHLAEGKFDLLTDRYMSIIYSGLVNSKELTNQYALLILADNIYKSDKLTLDVKARFFRKTSKKVLTIISGYDDISAPNKMSVSYFTSSVYEFISRYENSKGKLKIDKIRKVAIYHGTFDPFSLGQKEVALAARKKGYEVYIYINEFNWTRRTHPNGVRKKIIDLTLSDVEGVYSLPDYISLNFDNPDDLDKLHGIFPSCEIAIVSDRLTLDTSIYKDDDRFRNLVIERTGDTETGNDVLRIKESLQRINPEMIRNSIRNGWDMDDLVDSLAEDYIYENNFYKNEPFFKEKVENKEFKLILNEPAESIENDLASFDIDKDTYESHDSISLRRPIAGNVLMGILLYGDAEKYRDYISLIGIGTNEVTVIRSISAISKEPLHNTEQVILNEAVSHSINEGRKHIIVEKPDRRLEKILQLQGFLRRGDFYYGYVEKPIILFLDLQSTLKTKFRKNQMIRDEIGRNRDKLLDSIKKLYKNKIILVYDRSIMYERLVDNVLECNGVTREHGEQGKYLLVPYGDIFKRWILPNTVTKAFHTERIKFEYDKDFHIRNTPNYLSIDNQANVIKSFGMETILVDDILNTGQRLTELLKVFDRHGIAVSSIVAGLATRQGVKYAESRGISVKHSYYNDEITAWFLESEIYPFFGGVSAGSDKPDSSNFMRSLSRIVPYDIPEFEHGEKSEYIAFSKEGVLNAKKIMAAIEKVFLKEYGRNFHVSDLGEVFITPRIPDTILEDVRRRQPEEILDIILGQIKVIEKFVESN